ncbi:hypothetical protein TNCV_4930431 [Trichonephila clavipes]|nr:hypothetical protein TNCV_4930431 [Trichonephila clavipes]
MFGNLFLTADSKKFFSTSCRGENSASFLQSARCIRHEDSPRQDKIICSRQQLTPNHILECPTAATKLLKMGMVPLRDSLRKILYSPDAPRIAEAVIKTFDGIE